MTIAKNLEVMAHFGLQCSRVSIIWNSKVLTWTPEKSLQFPELWNTWMQKPKRDITPQVRNACYLLSVPTGSGKGSKAFHLCFSLILCLKLSSRKDGLFILSVWFLFNLRRILLSMFIDTSVGFEWPLPFFCIWAVTSYPSEHLFDFRHMT